MMRILLSLPLLFLFVSSSFAQTDSLGVDPAKVLSPERLASERMFYSIEDAMKEPGNVYKLSLQNQKLKSIPQDVFMLPNLHVLDLSNNRLKYIPDQIRELPYLQSLNLYNNKINYLPNGMQDLSQLRVLYVGRNLLTGMPAWVGGLGQLRRLDVSRNFLTTYEIELLRSKLPRCEVTN